MSYEKQTWNNGDVITAEKLNKMDNGWGTVDTQLFSESITMIDTDEYHYAKLPYSEIIDVDLLKVTFDGTEYVCPRYEEDDHISYGALSNDYSVYPFSILSGIYDDTIENGIVAQTGGTHSVTVVATMTEVSEEFKIAIAKTSPFFRIVAGQTTWREAYNALNEGKEVYILYDDGDKASILYAGYNSSGIRVVRGVRLNPSSDYPYAIQLTASSEDGVLH